MEITESFLRSALRDLKREIFSTLHVAAPGLVESYDPSTRTVSVRPALLRREAAGDLLSAPLLQSVPAFFWGDDPAPGDACLLIFADFCLDGFLSSAQPVLPPSPRMHDWSDAVALIRPPARPSGG